MFEALILAGVGLLAVVIVAAAWFLRRGQPALSSGPRRNRRASQPASGGRVGRGRSSIDPTWSGDESSSQRSHWDPYSARQSRSPDGGPEYRWRPREGDGRDAPWDPWAEDQSISSRIRANRKRAARPRLEIDYYQLLGLERGASDAEIVRAYRRHAATIHPDKFYDDPVRRRQAEEKLKQLNKAMEVLRDPVARARYDAQL